MTDQLAERVAGIREAAALKGAALVALEEHEAAAAAHVAQRDAVRLDTAENDLRRAVRAVIGDEPYYAVVGDIDLRPVPGCGYAARVLAGDLTLMVERPDEFSPTNVTLMAACPDCGEETAFGAYLTSLVDLGRAIRDSEHPCGECQRGARSWSAAPTPADKAWVITRLADEDEAARVASKWETEGYEVNVQAVEQDYVVSGHRFGGPAWG